MVCRHHTVMVAMPSASALASKLVPYVARIAAGIRVDRKKIEEIAGPSMARIALEVIDRVVPWIVTTRNGLLRCGLCGKGPFTKRGLYLHLIRVHQADIRYMIEDELERLIKVMHTYGAWKI